MYYALKEGRKVNLFTDQYRTPLSLFEASRIITELISKEVKKETLNFGGKERVSRFELGEILCEEAGFDKRLLNPLKMEEMPGAYKVADVSLNCDKLENIGIQRLSVRESVLQILRKSDN
jgi:dTDP-4-dehydrorhamnose reductase